MRIVRHILLWALLLLPRAQANFIEGHPLLKTFLFQEPSSPFYFGFGISPLSITKGSFGLSLSAFELYYQDSLLDLEIFSAVFGVGLGRDDLTSSRSFMMRVSPKYRVGQHFSAGFMVGYEFVSFPNVLSRIYKGNLFSPFEPFSSSSLVYGIAASQKFQVSGYSFQLSQYIYKQNYSTKTTNNGWNYNYQDSKIAADQSAISPGIVGAVELSLLY